MRLLRGGNLDTPGRQCFPSSTPVDLPWAQANGGWADNDKIEMGK